MKIPGLLTLIAGLVFLTCNQTNSTTLVKIQHTQNLQPDNKDKEEVQVLIRQVLKWAESKKSIDLLPALTDSKDSTCIGFDLNKHKANLDKLRETNFFASEFIENYNQIILTLDRKIKNNEFDKWNTYELPPFVFANDVDPWTLCQDIPYDKPSSWNYVEIEIVNLNNGKAEAVWKWGKLELNTSPDWKEFTYKFKAVKEDDRWKIAYMQGFDFSKVTQKEGL